MRGYNYRIINEKRTSTYKNIIIYFLAFIFQIDWIRIIEEMLASSEITVADVLRMIRQKQFINLAMSKAIKFLRDDIFIGETYDGEEDEFKKIVSVIAKN